MHVLVSSGNLSIEWKLHFISLVDHSTVYSFGWEQKFNSLPKRYKQIRRFEQRPSVPSDVVIRYTYTGHVLIFIWLPHFAFLTTPGLIFLLFEWALDLYLDFY